MVRTTAKTLVVIGNGFDLHHGIPSGYQHFVAYLKKVDHDLFRMMEDYLAELEEAWWNLEAALGEPDIDQMVEHAGDFLMSYGHENWRDSGHHDYQYELQQIAVGLSTRLLSRFTEWVRELVIPEHPLPHLSKIMAAEHLYFSFNYTGTLEATYLVPADQVLHIHGSTMDPTMPLVLGHDYDERPSRNDYFGIEDEDPRVIEGNLIIDKYFKTTFKPSATLIEKNKSFFRALKSIETVYVLGHSLASVDVPYLLAICAHIQMPARWIVAARSQNDAEEKIARLLEIGVSNHSLEGVLWEQLRSQTA